MGKTTITFRLGEEKKEALDAIAGIADRDRSYILNEAIDAYLDAHQWQIEHIKKGLRQAEAGQFASDREVARAFARWRR
jgi:predicted transcriptional regulator